MDNKELEQHEIPEDIKENTQDRENFEQEIENSTCAKIAIDGCNGLPSDVSGDYDLLYSMCDGKISKCEPQLILQPDGQSYVVKVIKLIATARQSGRSGARDLPMVVSAARA